MLGGSLIYCGIMMIQVIPSFWTIRSSAVGDVEDVFRTISRYPLTIFHKALQYLLTFVFPFAFINFFPAQILIPSNDFLGLPSYVKYLSLPVGIVFFLIMYGIWKIALKRYGSSGS